MDEFFQNLLNENKNVKTLKEYEEIVNKSGMMWKKPYEYNTPISGHTNFDDFFKIAGVPNAKLCKFIIKNIVKDDGVILFIKSTPSIVYQNI